jgi:hypothetical protein
LKQFGKNTTASIAAVNFIGNDSVRLNYEIGMYDKYFTWNTDKLFMPTIIEDDTSMSFLVSVLHKLKYPCSRIVKVHY